MVTAPEHVAFKKLTDATARAESAYYEMGSLRPDQAKGWGQFGVLLAQVKENCYKFIEKGLH